MDGMDDMDDMDVMDVMDGMDGMDGGFELGELAGLGLQTWPRLLLRSKTRSSQ
jgi:hypothetical protein